MALSLDRYLAYIGYQGPLRADLETLALLQQHHVNRIAFENLTPFLGEEVTLDPASLEDKLIHRGRGGYCYEHNLLFQAVLEQIGFRVRGLAARVYWNQPVTAQPARTHMLLRVTLNGEDYLVDTGFGAMTPTHPLKLSAREEQPTPLEPFRVREERDAFMLEARVGDNWRRLYQFDLTEQWQADYELASWYLSHHPQSHFVTGLTAVRATDTGRHTLQNHRYTLRYPNGEAQRQEELASEQVVALLKETFLINLEGREARLQEKLQQL